MEYCSVLAFPCKADEASELENVLRSFTTEIKWVVAMRTTPTVLLGMETDSFLIYPQKVIKEHIPNTVKVATCPE